jgi:hypothetical protein
MATAQALDLAGEDMNRWLHEAFEAERAPRPCRLPAPKVVEVAHAADKRSARLARGSFLLMLALSATGLLLQP